MKKGVTMRHRKSARAAAVVLAPTAASLGLLGISTHAAAAANLDRSQDVSFTDSNGSMWSCQLLWAQEYDPSTKQLTVYLFVERADSTQTGCYQGTFGDTTRIDTTYSQQSDGTQVTTTTYGTGGTGAVYNGVKDARISSTYEANFYDCNPNVSTCAYTFSLSQGK